MKLTRFVLLIALISSCATALFGIGEDKEQKRKEKRIRDAKTRDALVREKRQPSMKKFDLIPDESLQESEIKKFFSAPENIDTVTVEDVIVQKDDLYKVLESFYRDFEPEDLTTFTIDGSSIAILYEEINHATPTLVKGTYMLKDGNKDSKIAVIIQDPLKSIIYKRSEEHEGMITFNTTVPGQYTIIFSNLMEGSEKTCTLALHTFQEKKERQYDIDNEGNLINNNQDMDEEIKEEIELAGDQEIGNIRSLLRTIQQHSNQVQAETRISLQRQTSHNEDSLNNGSWHFYAMMVEVSLFIAILVFQLHHIKVSLDNKLVM